MARFSSKAAIGGTVGLLLLAAALAYRWFAPDAVDRELPAARAPAATPAVAPPPLIAAIPAAEPPVALISPVPDPIAGAPAEASLAEFSEEVRADVDDALARAAQALRDARLFAPPDDNALYWYEAALEVDPQNAAARAARTSLLTRLFEDAHVSLDAGDERPAQQLLEALRDVKLSRRAREQLAERVERMPQLQEHLRQAAQRMAAGQRFEPPGESALDSYNAARTLDPRNAAAQRGLAEVEQAVLARALAAASEDQYTDAERLLGLAGSVLPGSQAQLETSTRIVALRAERARGLVTRATAALDARDTEVAAQLVQRATDLGAGAELLQPIQERLANARIYDHYEPGQSLRDPFLDRSGTAPDMVVIPIGEFMMGAPESEAGSRGNERPLHRVAVARPFALARTEVTVAQFRRFVERSGHVTDAEKAGNSTYYDEPNGRLATGKGVDWRRDYMGERARDSDPVVHVSWNDASAYAAWLAASTGRAYRLPAEAEFEYALRGGSSARYWWGADAPARVLENVTGDGDRSPSRRSWTRAFPRYGDGYWGPAPVAKFAANPFALHDLAGNVSEWVEDCWHDSYLRAPEDGHAWVNRGCGRRVIRGGSWGSSPEQIRSAYRLNSQADVRSGRVGFRVARDL